MSPLIVFLLNIVFGTCVFQCVTTPVTHQRFNARILFTHQTMLAPLLKIWKGCANQGETVKPEQDPLCCSVSIPYKKHRFLVSKPNVPRKTCFSTRNELVISWCMTTLCLVELMTPWCMLSLCLSKYIYRIAWSIPCDHLLHNIWLPFRMICIFTFILTFHGSFSTSQLSYPYKQAYSCCFLLTLTFPHKRDLKKLVRGCSFKSRLKVRQLTGLSQGHLKIKACFHGISWIWSFSSNIQV